MRETLPRPPSSPFCSSLASYTPRHQLGQDAWSWIASQTGSRGESSNQVVRKAYSAIALSAYASRPHPVQLWCGVSPLPRCVWGGSTIWEKRITVTMSSSETGRL